MSRHLVDPELVALLDQIPDYNFTPESLAQIRAEINAGGAEQRAKAPAFPQIEVSERFVPGRPGDPDVRVLLYRPRVITQPLPALLWMHGGGYVMGQPEMNDLELKKKVTELGCVIASVDYRLSPETQFPGPIEDCYAALKWLHNSAAELGVEGSRIVIGGSSAGGGLCAALALLARDRAEIPVAFQLLVYPMLDDRTVTAPAHPHCGKLTWSASTNAFGWAAMLGQAPGSEGISCYAAPARAEDLTGLPPTFICVGALDLFLEEDMEYARRLMRAGVPTELHVYPGTYHLFMRAATAQVTVAYQRDHMNALRRAMFA